MKLRLSAFLFIALLFAACSAKESLMDRFKTDLDSFTEAYNSGDWEKVTSMMYPKLFTVTSKEELVRGIKTLDTMGMKTKIKISGIDNISEIVESGGDKFVLINYRTNLHIELSGKMWEQVEPIKAGFEAKFGAENIKFDREKKTFNIAGKQKMIASTPKDKNDWKYIEHDTNIGDYITRMIIPEDVLKKFEGK